MEVIFADFDYTAFGLKLKAAREKAGLTQAQVCAALGIPKAQILSSYERGISSPRIDVLASLAVYYGVTVDSLLYSENGLSIRGEMSTSDWLLFLVHAADKLHIEIRDANFDESTSAKNCSTGILVWGQDSAYHDFFSKWSKLWTALNDGLIDRNDYYHLIARHLDQIEESPDYKGVTEYSKNS